MMSGHYAANVTVFVLIPLSPLTFRLRLFIDKRGGAPLSLCGTRRITLYPVGTTPYQGPLMQQCEGTGAPREDGTILPDGVLQPRDNIGHTSNLGISKVSFVSFRRF
jgi:hypothetical protein